MKIAATLSAATIVLVSVPQLASAETQSNIHLRIHEEGYGGCAHSWSQCDGQNWSSATCCREQGFVCKASPDRPHSDHWTRLCLPKATSGYYHHKHHGKHHDDYQQHCITDYSQCDGQNWYGPTCCQSHGFECKVSPDRPHSDHWTRLCLPKATSGYYHHKHHGKHHDDYEQQCITDNSQCGGQNWSGATCCQNPDYECKASPDRPAEDHWTMLCLPKGNDYESDSPDYESEDKDYEGDSPDYESEDNDVYDSYDGEKVGAWDDCTNGKQCVEDYECIVQSDYYAQCMPSELEAEALCGQKGDQNWDYAEACPEGYECKARHHGDKDLRCLAY